MQVTIARQLGLEPTTVGNFFMNARRRSHDKWREGPDDMDMDDDDLDCSNENIKYEVYDCGGEAGMDAGQGGGYQDGGYDNGMMGYDGMTSIPAPVHNPHTQLQSSYPSTCA